MRLIVYARGAVLRWVTVVVGQPYSIGPLLEVVLKARRECVLSGFSCYWECHFRVALQLECVVKCERHTRMGKLVALRSRDVLTSWNQYVNHRSSQLAALHGASILTPYALES
jgi:hypothetical protein